MMQSWRLTLSSVEKWLRWGYMHACVCVCACVCEMNWSPHTTSHDRSPHMTSHNTEVSEINWSPHILGRLISAFTCKQCVPGTPPYCCIQGRAGEWVSLFYKCMTCGVLTLLYHMYASHQHVYTHSLMQTIHTELSSWASRMRRARWRCRAWNVSMDFWDWPRMIWYICGILGHAKMTSCWYRSWQKNKSHNIDMFTWWQPQQCIVSPAI